MPKNADTNLYRVVYLSGGSFYTNARTATQYVLDPIFIQFMVFSILMFASLMLVLGIPFIPQLILFGAGVVSTFFWLTLAIVFYLAVLRPFGGRTIYTPLLLLPMQVLNTVCIEYVLRIFDRSFGDGFNSIWEFSLRTLIVIVCLDIFHGKFVAPQHSLYVAAHPRGEAKDRERNVELAPVTKPVSVASAEILTAGNPDQAVPSDDAETPEGKPADATEKPAEPVSSVLNVGAETFDLNTIRYIKSEDHYLFVQQADQGKLVRGRLRDVADTIDVSWGLQINRSVWVAYSAIEAVQETSNGRLDVRLFDENVFRVAEARRVFFLHNFNLHDPSVQTG